MALSTLHKSTQGRTLFVPEFPKDLQQYILLQLDDNDLAKTFRTSKEAAIFVITMSSGDYEYCSYIIQT